jgi:hypothetical protein
MLAPFLLGLAGSLHCVGMCGPLMLALPLEAASKRQLLGQLSVYHLGRIGMYAALGVFFGLIGQGVAIAGFQQILSIAAGILMIAMAFVAWRFEQLVTALPGFGKFTRRIQFEIGKRLRTNQGRTSFLVGMFNGLLPCGMVYAALAGAIASVGGVSGGLFMAVFGLGTLPLLFAATFFGRSFSVTIRKKARFLQPLLLVLAGALLLQRGLHLDLSLFESAVPKAGYECH